MAEHWWEHRGSKFQKVSNPRVTRLTYFAQAWPKDWAGMLVQVSRACCIAHDCGPAHGASSAAARNEMLLDNE